MELTMFDVIRVLKVWSGERSDGVRRSRARTLARLRARREAEFARRRAEAAEKQAAAGGADGGDRA